ncbi:profilin [Streptomyces sp. RLB1-9]|uniref:profilin n=1 Tax=Streptomyces sp. RLB1-9 TaxID=2594454 RepID=UPI0013DD4FEC|nr:profilin [Streptomyces sp. RLB1-9]
MGDGRVDTVEVCGAADGGDHSRAGQVSPQEGAAIAAAFSDPNTILTSGFMVSGQKYFTLSANAESIYGKRGNNGVSCVKTTQSILVGVYEAPIQPGESANEVGKLADYLRNLGY